MRRPVSGTHDQRPDGRRAGYLVERNLLVYRRAWMIVFSGLFEPVFYLFSIGLGIGALVGDVAVGGAQVGYAAFVAPALLASAAMNGAVLEATNVFFRMRYGRNYDAILATPVGPLDIALGEVAFSQLRGLLYATGFLAVMAVLGLVPSWWGLLALPAAMLIGCAFAAVGMVAATYMRSYLDLDYVQMAILPLFLLSATFFPLEVYPSAVRWLVQLSPLYHGVTLVRGLTLGQPDAGMLWHVGFLVAMALAGLRVVAGRMRALLLR